MLQLGAPSTKSMIYGAAATASVATVGVLLCIHKIKSSMKEKVASSPVLSDSQEALVSVPDNALCNNFVEHYGSCHCRRLRFKIKSASILNVVEVSSKIRFPRVTVPCTDFEIMSDDRVLSMYTVKYGAGMLGIHTFCSHCGVQVLYSPTVEPSEVQVNVDCLDKRSIEDIRVTQSSEGETQRLINHELETIFNRQGTVTAPITERYSRLVPLPESRASAGCGEPNDQAVRASLRNLDLQDVLTNDPFGNYFIDTSSVVTDVSDLDDTISPTLAGYRRPVSLSAPGRVSGADRGRSSSEGDEPDTPLLLGRLKKHLNSHLKTHQ